MGSQGATDGEVIAGSNGQGGALNQVHRPTGIHVR